MLYRIRDIVAGIASPEDDPILVPALELARRCDAFLHVVHAPEVDDLVWSDGAQANGGSRGVPDSAVQEQPFGIEDRVDYHAIDGAPGPGILSVARAVPADLIIVGATRRNRLGAALFGSTARRVARDADVPVLVLRGHAPHDISRVLVPTDLSPLSGAAHEIGLDVVDTLFPGEEVAIRAVDVAFDDPTLAPPFRGTVFEGPVRAELDAYLASRRRRSRPVQAHVRFGDAVGEIVEEAESWRADLIVLGSQGRTGAARVMMGSVAEGVLGRAKSSVLIVPRAAVQRMTVPVPAATAHLPVATS